MRAIKTKKQTRVFSLVLGVNLLLFALKLYIGLSSNSISIYSDGINNLFDGLSCVAALLCACFVAGMGRMLRKKLYLKLEGLLGFGFSLVIFAVGVMFLYNSAERLLYPAPVWYSTRYFFIILITALVKLLLFFFLRKKAKTLSSEVIRVMSLDSLADFFVTSVTVLTLLLSRSGGYSLDALGGIIISAVIIITSLKSVRESLSGLIGLPDKKTRLRVEELLSESLLLQEAEIEFSLLGEKSVYVKNVKENISKGLEELRQKVYNETGIKMYILNKEE